MIPDEKKEEVRDAADIVDVVSDYVKLKRSGSGFVGLCPFHNEKTPSFHVTPRLGIYKCFGCGAGGDVFNFVMEMEGVGFTEAIRELASRFGVFVPEEEEEPEYDEQMHLKEGIYHALRFAGLFFYRSLIEKDEAENARAYLKKRGLNAQTIKKYGLGYAPDQWDGLLKAAESAGVKEQYLQEAGLIKYGRNGEKAYDTFRNRIMFPIFNPTGKVIAFGGRVVGQAKSAKYINSPQTLVYNKSEVLYGIQVAKNEIRKEKEAILVEGYTDVLSLHQAGIRNVISTSGTALTLQQMRSVHRYGDTLLMIYDSDSAGQNAMIRGLNIALREGLEVRLLQLPEGEDPDSFVRQFGNKSFLEYKKKDSKDFITFILNKAQQAHDWDDPAHKKRTISQLLYSIAHIPDAVTRETFVLHLNQKVKVGDRALFEELGKKIAELKRDEAKEKQRISRFEKTQDHGGLPRSEANIEKQATHQVKRENTTSQNGRTKDSQVRMASYEKEVIRLMLEYGRKMVEYIGKLCNADHFESENLKMFFEDIIKRYQDEKDISIDVYMSYDPPWPEMVSEIVMDAYGVSEKGMERTGVQVIKDSNPYKTAKGALKALKLHYLNRLKKDFEKAYQSSSGDEKIEINRLLTEVSRERMRLEVITLDELFPDPPQEEETGDK
ncbi:MAG TPA: DNA primase [Balneolales bacterium]|nr:DNA primase [Balneolales bacterium]